MSYIRSSNTIINDTAGGDSVKAALTTRLSTAVDNLYAVANLIDADVIAAQAAADGKPELGETSSTAYRGDRGKTAYDHSQSAHAPSTAQKNSDITKEEIEAKLTGEISSHSHAAATLPTASATVSGIVELATTAEAETGTDTARAVTPAGVAAAIAALSSVSESSGIYSWNIGTLRIRFGSASVASDGTTDVSLPTGSDPSYVYVSMQSNIPSSGISGDQDAWGGYVLSTDTIRLYNRISYAVTMSFLTIGV